MAEDDAAGQAGSLEAVRALLRELDDEGNAVTS